MHGLRLGLVSLLVTIGSIACSAEARPDGETAGESVTSDMSTEVAPPVCDPGTTRKCTLYWTTKAGSLTIKNCTESTQKCSESGYWGVCGAGD